MFGIAAIVAFVVAIILQGIQVSKPPVFTVVMFALIGLLCLTIHLVYPWVQQHRRPTP
jgi:predicted membrane channel-forming protein YqfA (hemolysin III family)